MSNLPNSIAHKTNHPADSGLFIAFCNGLFVCTTMVCAWKYGLSFQAATTRAKASFSIKGVSSLCPSKCSVGVVHRYLYAVFFLNDS